MCPRQTPSSCPASHPHGTPGWVSPRRTGYGPATGRVYSVFSGLHAHSTESGTPPFLQPHQSSPERKEGVRERAGPLEAWYPRRTRDRSLRLEAALVILIDGRSCRTGTYSPMAEVGPSVALWSPPQNLTRQGGTDSWGKGRSRRVGRVGFRGRQLGRIQAGFDRGPGCLSHVHLQVMRQQITRSPIYFYSNACEEGHRAPLRRFLVFF